MDGRRVNLFPLGETGSGLISIINNKICLIVEKNILGTLTNTFKRNKGTLDYNGKIIFENMVNILKGTFKPF